MVCLNYRNPQLSGAKSSQYVVYLHKNFLAKDRDNAVQTAKCYQNCPPYVLPLPCNVSLNATSLWHHCLLAVNTVFTEDKVAIKFLCENTHYGAKNFPQSNGCWVYWTEFWRKSMRQVVSNEWKVPVDCGQRAATTTSNALAVGT